MSAVAVSQQTRQSHRFEGSWRYSLRCEKQPASSVHDQLTRCEKLLTQKAKFRTEGNYMRRPHCTLAALASSRGIWVHSPAQIVWEFVPSAALWFMLFRSCCKWTGRLEEPRHFADFDTEGCQPETHSFNTCFVSRRSIGTFKTAKALVRIACGISCISFHFQVVSPQQRDDNSVDELWISVGPIQPHEDFCREAATGFPFHLCLGQTCWIRCLQRSIPKTSWLHLHDRSAVLKIKQLQSFVLQEVLQCSSFNAIMLPLLRTKPMS